MATATLPSADHRWVTARRIAGAVAALASGLVGLLVSQSLILSRAAPERALAVWPWNDAARAEQATVLLTQAQDSITAGRVRDLSVAALQGQPLSLTALRALGAAQALAGENARAQRTMTFAETLSRRDLPTELWLIEDGVGHGDVAGALIHYDRALRTADSAPDLLFPVLIAASGDPAVVGSMSRLIAKRPLWWRDYAERLIHENPSSAATAAIVGALRLDPRVPDEETLLASAATRLANAGRADLAHKLVPTGGLIRNGGFDGVPGSPPFEWRLAEDGDLGAEIETRAHGRGNALFLDARTGRGGEVARQLLTLAPGRYRILGTVGDVAAPGEAPALVVTCAGTAREIGRFQTGVAPASGARFEADVSVPAGCIGQWLIVEANPPFEVSDRRPWIDDLRIALE